MIDKHDKRILEELQTSSDISISDLADKIGLSSTPCWRRIQALEKSGVIRKKVALLDAAQLNVGLTVFVMVKTNQHNQTWLEEFSSNTSELPEIMEFYRLSGDTDYLLKVVVPDMKAFDLFYKKLIAKADFADISSSFAMEEIKYTTQLPTDYLSS